MKIVILTHSSDLYQKLTTYYFEPQGITCHHFKETLPLDIEAIVLIDPYPILGDWVSTSSIWKKWLMNKKLHPKLIVASFQAHPEHDHHLDLLKLPSSFQEFVKQVPTTRDLPTPLVFGVALEGKFRIFLDGHGQESLLKLITQLRSSFDTALFMLDDGETFEVAWESMLKVVGEMIGDQLIDRWEKYRSFFEPTPFYKQFQAYDQSLLQSLNAFYKEEATEKKLRELTPELTELSQYLRKIDDLLSKA